MPVWFKQQIKQIDIEANQLNRWYAEIKVLVKSAEQRPKPSDVNAACRTLKTNMGRLIHQNRLNVLEALKVRVQTVQTARIEGVLPVVSTVQEDIELTPLRRGLRGEVTKF